MKLDISVKNYELPSRLNELLKKKFDRLDKYFKNDEPRAKVLCRVDKDICTLEGTIYCKSDVLRAEVSSNEMYDNVDLLMPKLERQIIKLHTKKQNKAKKNQSKERDLYMLDVKEREYFFEPVESHPAVPVRRKTFELSPIEVEDAITNLELVDHDFYVFQATSGNVCVVYKRDDGQYGLIETLTSKGV